MRIHRFLSWLTALLIVCAAPILLHNAALAAEPIDVQCQAEIAVYSISQERYVRSCGQVADLSALGTDEYYSFVLNYTSLGSQTKEIRNFYVRVDDGPKWAWASSSLSPHTKHSAHIYYSNMKNLMKPGTHKAVWYMNDTPVMTQSFTLTSAADWYGRFPIPSAAEIQYANQTAAVRSPYLCGWLDIGSSVRYSEYAVDFKADFLPKATYCALANVKMDFSGLEKKYKNVHTDGHISLYAGFQRRWNEYITIMSAWDIYYTDKNGVEHTLRPRQIYPDKIYIGNGSFGGEGTGLQMLMPFDWEANHWYRMLLQCGQSENGTTTVEQWVCDLETGKWTLMCKCDTGLPDSCFVGPCAFFLENFDNDLAGEVRAMEVANVRIREVGKSSWRSIRSASLSSNGGLPHYNGSYAYGADENSFFMITSGAGGDWFGTNRAPKNHRNYTVNHGASTSPY